MPETAPVDAVIFGGGVAGLWLLDDLVRAGHAAVLLESAELGSGQTIASQGIIHGGLKYALGGVFTPSAKAVRRMPHVWRRCLAGEATPNLSNTRLRSSYCHLWQTTSLKSKLAMIGARAGLHIAPVKLGEDQRPTVLADCPGTVARLDEQVIEPASLLTDLREQHRARLMKVDVENGLEFVLDSPGAIRLIRLIDPESGEPLDLQPRWTILAAGAGNGELRTLAGLDARAMQLRPLHMVMMRGDLPILNAHCVDGLSTRVTITTTSDSHGRTIWQVGGQIAERGVGFDETRLLAHARAELREVLPSLDVGGVEWASYRVDRAEARTRGGTRPDDSSALREGNIITAWPTKLALTPQLAGRVLESIGVPVRPSSLDSRILNQWPRPVVALPPWETSASWTADL